MTRRRIDQLSLVLGALWILDGLLQLQPYMLGPRFFSEVLGMADMGLPGFLHALEWRITQLTSAHPLPWDLSLAATQLTLGVGIIATRTRRVATALSVPWALFVWIVGEGVGGLFMPGASLLTGAPGAALLYAVAAVLLTRANREPTQPSLIARLHGRYRRVERIDATFAWAVLWVGGALLEFCPANHAAGVPAAQIGNGAAEQPGPIGTFSHLVASTVGHNGFAFAVTAAVVQAGIGMLALPAVSRRPALAAGVCVSVLYWVAGQHLGDVFSGRATDLAAGPLWVLLAALTWRPSPAGDPAADERTAAPSPSTALLAS